MAILRRSRDIWHRVAGYIWVSAMLLVAVTSFWISFAPMFGPFSPIHLLSVLTIYSLWQAITAIRARDVKAHEGYMRALYFWSLGVAGLFTFLPGRRMNDMFFAAAPQAGFAFMAALIGGGLLLYLVRRRRHAN